MSTTIPKGSSIERIRANLKANIEQKKQERNTNQYHNSKWNKYYGNKAWKELRNWYISEHPLCENHLRYGIRKTADNVHHKCPFSTANTEEGKYILLLSQSNLMSLCKECHREFHAIAKQNGLNYIDNCIPIELKKY